jgi:hypothetical protein
VQELVDRGLLTPQQAAHHPDANRITRALGMSTEVEADLRAEPVRHVPGDSFVLCSDGLSDLVEDHEILGIVGSEPAAQAVGKLVDVANARGGHDNITVVVLRAREAAQVPSGPVAPTIAQTAAPATALMSATQAPATIPNAAPAFPAHSDRATEPLMVPPAAVVLASAPAPAPAPVLAPTFAPAPAPAFIPSAPEPSPPSSRTLPERHPTSPAIIIGVVLAVLAMGILAAVLLSHLGERGGVNRKGPGGLALPTPDGAPPPMPTTLVPSSVVLPPATSASEPIAPLQPSPSSTGKGSH